MKKMIVHCGAHKTATSSLQLFLKQNSDWLIERGVQYIAPDSLNESKIPHYLRGETKTSNNDTPPKLSELIQVGEKSDIETILISHESFLSHAGNPIKGPIYPSLGPALERAADLLQDYSVEIIFCVREPSRFTESLFLQNLGIIFSGSFEDFFNELNPQNLNWLPIAKKLSEFNHASSVNLFPYELLQAHGPESFLQHFLFLAGIKDKSPHPLPRTNESFSQNAADELQRMGKSILELSPAERRAKRRLLAEKYPSPRYRRARILHPEHRNKMNSSLTASNLTLFEKFMPDFDPDLWRESAGSSSEDKRESLEEKTSHSGLKK